MHKVIKVTITEKDFFKQKIKIMTYLILIVVLLLPYLTSGLQRKQFGFVQKGLTFQGLSKMWNDKHNDVDCSGLEFGTARCTERYVKYYY